MEGFFETFIYLIITIVILVLSLRKKKKPVQESVDEERPGDPLSDLFSDEDEQEEEYQPAPKPATVQAEGSSASDSRPVQWISNAEAKEMLMDADEVMKEAAENNPIAEFEGEVESVQDDAYNADKDEKEGIAFDLKKAVIYSEILSRRTY